jgi:hypothetical protein
MGDGGARFTFENEMTVNVQIPATFNTEDARKSVADLVSHALKNVPATAMRGVRALRITVMA